MDTIKHFNYDFIWKGKLSEQIELMNTHKQLITKVNSINKLVIWVIVPVKKAGTIQVVSESGDGTKQVSNQVKLDK